MAEKGRRRGSLRRCARRNRDRQGDDGGRGRRRRNDRQDPGSGGRPRDQSQRADRVAAWRGRGSLGLDELGQPRRSRRRLRHHSKNGRLPRRQPLPRNLHRWRHWHPRGSAAMDEFSPAPWRAAWRSTPASTSPRSAALDHRAASSRPISTRPFQPHVAFLPLLPLRLPLGLPRPLPGPRCLRLHRRCRKNESPHSPGIRLIPSDRSMRCGALSPEG